MSSRQAPLGGRFIALELRPLDSHFNRSPIYRHIFNVGVLQFALLGVGKHAQIQTGSRTKSAQLLLGMGLPLTGNTGVFAVTSCASGIDLLPLFNIVGLARLAQTQHQ